MNAQTPTTLLNQAIREGWNHEMDWLWLTTKVPQIEQQVVCLERALHINPHTRDTQRQLKQLSRQMTQHQAQQYQQLIAQLS